MGATNFSNLELIKGDANDAYGRAIENANDYNGHQEGYSGDIQTAEGFYMRTDNPRFGTKAFYKWTEKHLDAMDKGECYCVEIKGATLKRLKGRTYKGRRGIRGFYFFGMARC